MKSIVNKLARKLLDLTDDYNGLQPMRKQRDDPIYRSSLTFKTTFHQAVGGTLVQFIRESRDDEYATTLYFISDKDNFGDQINKIFMIERMK